MTGWDGNDETNRAADIYNMSMQLKVDQEPRGFLAQRAIGSGFHSILFADCRSAADVQECVRIVRAETPEDGGTYGVATRRFTYMGYGGTKEYVQALRDIVVAIMIEKPGTVDTLEDVLSVKGVDMVQWGGSDYSMGIGRAGERQACLVMGRYTGIGVRHGCRSRYGGRAGGRRGNGRARGGDDDEQSARDMTDIEADTGLGTEASHDWLNYRCPTVGDTPSLTFVSSSTYRARARRRGRIARPHDLRAAHHAGHAGLPSDRNRPADRVAAIDGRHGAGRRPVPDRA